MAVLPHSIRGRNIKNASTPHTAFSNCSYKSYTKVIINITASLGIEPRKLNHVMMSFQVMNIKINPPPPPKKKMNIYFGRKRVKMPTPHIIYATYSCCLGFKLK